MMPAVKSSRKKLIIKSTVTLSAAEKPPMSGLCRGTMKKETHDPVRFRECAKHAAKNSADTMKQTSAGAAQV